MSSKYLEKFDESDIVFEINNVRIYAIKACLSICSPVFKAMFTANFKERESNEISLPGKDVNTFLCLMEFVHPPCICDEPGDVRKLIGLSEEYQILWIKLRCEQLLLNEPNSIVDFNLCSKYNLNLLRSKILKEITIKPAKSLKDDCYITSLFPEGKERELFEILLDKCIASEKKLDNFKVASKNELDDFKVASKKELDNSKVAYEKKLDNFKLSLNSLVSPHAISISQCSSNSNEPDFTFSASLIDILTSDGWFIISKYQHYAHTTCVLSTRINAQYLEVILTKPDYSNTRVNYNIKIISDAGDKDFPKREFRGLTSQTEFMNLFYLLDSNNGFLQEGHIIFRIHIG